MNVAPLQIIHAPERSAFRKRRLGQQLGCQRIRREDVRWHPGVWLEQDARANVAAAHTQCVQWAAEEGYDVALVAEDDVRFPAPGAYARFLALLGGLPDDWQLFNSGPHVTQQQFFDRQGGIARMGIWGGMQLYAVKTAMLPAFQSCPYGNDIDLHLSAQPEVVTYGAWPLLTDQHDGWSFRGQRHAVWSGFWGTLPRWQP